MEFEKVRTVRSRILVCDFVLYLVLHSAIQKIRWNLTSRERFACLVLTHNLEGKTPTVPVTVPATNFLGRMKDTERRCLHQ